MRQFSLRLPLAFLGAISVTLGLFAIMNNMVSSGEMGSRNKSKSGVIDFISATKDSDLRLKERQYSEPPKPQKPKIEQQLVNDQSSEVQPLDISMPDMAPDLDLSSNSFLGDASVGMGFGDGDVIPLVRMPAQYPPGALRKNIEDFVKAVLKINAEGSVDDVEIIDSKPKGIFERSSRRALYKYKFKPKIVNGKAQPQVVFQTLIFGIDKG